MNTSSVSTGVHKKEEEEGKKENTGVSSQAAQAAQPLASRSSSNAPCDPAIPCVPRFHKNSNGSLATECDDSLVSAERCYKERMSETPFYEAINWDYLAENIEQFMNIFVQRINYDEPLSRFIQNAYIYGPLPDPRNPKPIKYVRAELEKNDDWNKCQNIIVKFTLPVGEFKRGFSLGHISLHPKLSKYYRDKTRSRSGCGYYKKEGACGSTDVGKSSAAAAAAPASAGAGPSVCNGDACSGPFHYKVDSLFYRDKGFHCDRDMIPFIQFHVDPQNPVRFIQETVDLRPQLASYAAKIAPKLSTPVKLKVEKGVLTKVVKPEVKRRTDAFFSGQNVTPKEHMLKMTQIEEQVIDEMLRAGTIEINTNATAEVNEQLVGTTATSIDEQIEALNNFHTRVASMFIHFWNTEMIPGGAKFINNNTSPLNSIVKPAYGAASRNEARAATGNGSKKATGNGSGQGGGTRRHKRKARKTWRARTRKH